MKISRFIVLSIFLMVMILGITMQAQADLYLIGQGTSAHGTYNLIYDTDLDITWYDYTNPAAIWQDQMAWVSALSVNFGVNTYTAWRLPATVDGPFVYGYDGTTTAGYNITNGEMGDLYYTELGNLGEYDTSGDPTGCGSDCLTNTGDFQNLLPTQYWSSTSYLGWPDVAWRFIFDRGIQYYGDALDLRSGIAVHDGLLTPNPSVYQLPATGQTTSYAAGDDGELQMGAAWPSPRFTNPDGSTPVSGGIVLDQLTGLYFQRNGNSSGLRNFDNGLTYCSNLVLTDNNGADYSDLRMPNMLELESVINYGFNETSWCSGAGCSSNAEWLNDEGFQNVQEDKYWASTAYAGVNAGGWMINFDPVSTTGFSERQDNYSWSSTFRTICVQGGANGVSAGYPAEVRKTGQTISYKANDDGDLQMGITAWDAERFTDNFDGTMTDNLTGIMWTQDGSLGLTIGAGGSIGAIHDFTKVQEFIDDMNTGTYGRCAADSSNLPICYPFENSCGPGNDQPCPLARIDCPTDFTCAGAVEANPWDSWPVTGAQYGECMRSTVDIPCNTPEDCPEIIGGENPGTYSDICVSIPNYGYTDWRMPNFRELYSMTHFEDEFSYNDLESYGFTNLGNAGNTINGNCGIWSSTTAPTDSTMVYSTGLGMAANAVRKYSKDTTGLTACGAGHQNPILAWPVRDTTVCSNSLAIIESQSYESDILQSAYSVAYNGAVIKSHAVIFYEDLNMNILKSVYLRAGYDCDYTDPPAGITVLNGNMTVSNGTFIVQSGTLSLQ